MPAISHEIARHNNLVWSAASEAAGPYQLGDWMFVWVELGARRSGISRPGSLAQQQSFRASRAAFYALRALVEGNVTRAQAKAAAVAARAAVRIWRNQSWDAVSEAAFQRDVERRVEVAFAGTQFDRKSEG